MELSQEKSALSTLSGAVTYWFCVQTKVCVRAWSEPFHKGNQTKGNFLWSKPAPPSGQSYYMHVFVDEDQNSY